MKKVYFFNHIMLAGKDMDIDWKKKLEYTGNNTGNILFVDSMKEQVNYSLELWFSKNNCYAGKENSVVGVLPMANLIGVHSNNAEAWCELIKDVPFPIVPVGMGAQSTKELNTPKKLVDALPDSRVNAIRTMAERVKSFGVRGEFTAECLELMGIKNYRIIGCPSAYKYLNGVYKEVKTPTMDKVVCNITAGNKYESMILDLAMKNPSKWLMQTSLELPEVCLGNECFTEKKKEYAFPEIGHTNAEVEAYTKENGKMFFRTSDWYDFLEKESFTFSFGSRFHGNMFSLRTGIPALWVVHDSRTRELVNTFSLPSIECEKMEEIKHIDELIEYCDYSDFYKKYREKSAEYVRFLEENEISHKFELNV